MGRKRQAPVVWLIGIMVLSAVLVWRGEGREKEENRNGENSAAGYQGEMEAGGAETARHPLETFGGFVEQTYRDGQKSSLGDRVISQRLMVREAAALAEGSPLLAHIKGYCEYPESIPPSEVCLLAADINFDGIKDIIEYAPEQGEISWYGNQRSACRLVIFLGEEGGGYRLSYSQMLFPTKCDIQETIEVLEYGGEAYLMFLGGYNTFFSDHKMTFYWLRDGIPCGKMDFWYQCRGMDVQVLEDSGVYDMGALDGKWMDIYHEAAGWRHCGYRSGREAVIGCGNAETEITDGERGEALRVKYDGKNKTELAEYFSRFGGGMRGHTPYSAYYFEGDIDNDGMAEVYARQRGQAMMEAENMGTEDSPWHHWSREIIYGDGKPHGSHEGKNRLFYYMESSGEETDFGRMCGLDLWEGGLVPQWFWLEKSGEGNITCIARRDRNGHEQRLEGYLVRDGAYRKVFSVSCVPRMECRATYEYKGKTGDGNRDFFFRRAEDGMMEMVFGNDGELQETVNRNIRGLFAEIMSSEDFEGKEYEYVKYCPVRAYRNVIYVAFEIVYSEGKNEERRLLPEGLRGLEINLLTGECREVDRKVCYGMDEQERLQW